MENKKTFRRLMAMAGMLFGAGAYAPSEILAQTKEKPEKDPNSPKIAKAEAKRQRRAEKRRKQLEAQQKKPVCAQQASAPVVATEPSTKMAVIHGQTVKVTSYPSVKSNPEYYWDRQQTMNANERKRMF